MKRRDLIALLGGATLLRPLAADAEQRTTAVIGFLGAGSAGLPSVTANLAAFHRGLAEIGHIEGQNLVSEYCWAEGQYDRLPEMAADLVGRKVNVIAIIGGTAPALAAKQATTTIPIVFVTGDPVTAGLVTSLSKPGGNLTGSGIIAIELMPKRFEFLVEILPDRNPVALLVNQDNPRSEHVIKRVREAARETGREFHVLRANTEGQIDAAFTSLKQLRASGLMVAGPDPYFSMQRNQLIASASRYAVPAIYAQREFVTSGGLMSYGPSFAAAYHQAGIYAGRILDGAKPGDLPIQQPTKFELVINLKTANALGLSVPQSLLARADEVIE